MLYDRIMRSTGRLGASLAGLVLLLAGMGTAQAVPSFSRQTSMPCAACHTEIVQATSD